MVRLQHLPCILGISTSPGLEWLQVFIHDPLYKWAMTPQGAQQRQHDDPEAGLLDGTDRDARPLNADAERALLRVKQKLKGLEGGPASLAQLFTPAAVAFPLSTCHWCWPTAFAQQACHLDLTSHSILV